MQALSGPAQPASYLLVELNRLRDELNRYKTMFAEAEDRAHRLASELEELKADRQSAVVDSDFGKNGPFQGPHRTYSDAVECLLDADAEEQTNRAFSADLAAPSEQAKLTASLIQATSDSAKALQEDRKKAEQDFEIQQRRSPWQILADAARDDPFDEQRRVAQKSVRLRHERSKDDASSDGRIAAMLNERELAASDSNLQEQFEMWEGEQRDELSSEDLQEERRVGTHDSDLDAASLDVSEDLALCGSLQRYQDGESQRETHVSLADLDEFID
ncbi:unnamed protein product [Parajaminaea phylloscopi]